MGKENTETKACKERMGKGHNNARAARREGLKLIWLRMGGSETKTAKKAGCCLDIRNPDQ